MLPRRRRSSHTPVRGFTLIEAVAAVIILSVAIPPMVWAIRASHIQHVTPAQVVTARWLAAERMEQVVADWQSPTRGYSWLQSSAYSDENSVTGFPGFSRTVEINERAADLVSPGADAKVVIVQVSWRDGSGNSRSLRLATAVTDLTP